MPDKQPNMQKKQVEEKFLIQLQNNYQRALAGTIDNSGRRPTPHHPPTPRTRDT
mgnify:CR=1 FL=1